jgi:hypothetical protein
MQTLRLLATALLLMTLAITTDLDGSPHTALAGGKVYWTSGSKIQRANPDGTGLEDIVTGLKDAAGLALDAFGCKMYWTQYQPGQIGRADLTGHDVETLVTGLTQQNGILYSPTTIALDLLHAKMYWANDYSGDEHGSIARANLDGTDVEALITDQQGATAVALDVAAGKVYWAGCCNGSDYIRRADLDGNGIEELLVVSQNPALALDPTAGKIYFSTLAGIQRANLDGTAVQLLVSGARPPSIALDTAGAFMYWVEFKSNAGPARIRRATLDGTGVQDVFVGVFAHAVAFLPPPQVAWCVLAVLQSEALKPQVPRWLSERINIVIRLLNGGHMRPAVNVLTELVKRVERVVAAGDFPASDGRQIITLATEAVDQLQDAVEIRRRHATSKQDGVWP